MEYFSVKKMVKSADNSGSPIAPFLTKCYDMVDDECTDAIISWSATSDSFVIWDMTDFSRDLLPRYFKHSNFSSFMRQLNIYGFKKTDTDRWEFANDGFIKGQKHLLKNISRRKHSHGHIQQNSSQPKDKSAESYEEKSENFGLWKEVQSLKTDRSTLMQELVKLSQHQESAQNKMLLLGERLQGMEENQQQMLSFLVMAMQSPGLNLVQLLQPKENNWRMSESIKNLLQQGAELVGEPVASDGMIIPYRAPVNESPATAPMEKLPPELDLSSDALKDLLLNIDFIPRDEKLVSSEDCGPIILPDFLDDDVLEQLLLASPVAENTEDGTKLNDQNESAKESTTICGTHSEMSQKFAEGLGNSQYLETDLTVSGSQREKSNGLEFLTEQMELLASQNN